MRTRIGIASAVALALVSFAPTRGVNAEDASATLPLTELLELYEGKDDQENGMKSPLVDAALQSVAFKGRLLDGAVELAARCEVEVLETDEWVRVPLFPLSDGVHLARIPDLEEGAFMREDGTLFFTVRGAGRYRFTLHLLFEAESEASLRRVAIERGPAPAVSLHIEYDEDLFELRNKIATRDAQGATLLAADGQFRLEWEQRTTSPVTASTPRPAVEARVEALRASSIATLEGDRITRLFYQLRFAGNAQIDFEIPAGERLLRVYRNGIAIPAKAQERTLHVDLTPARLGGKGGSVELVLAKEERSGFHLDGRLRFVFPRCSWPTRELFLNTHLPNVFNYEWRGGSLAPSGATPDTQFSYALPTPGTALSFHQALVSSSAPDLELEYTVDLEGHYYRIGDF